MHSRLWLRSHCHSPPVCHTARKSCSVVMGGAVEACKAVRMLSEWRCHTMHAFAPLGSSYMRCKCTLLLELTLAGRKKATSSICRQPKHSSYAMSGLRTKCQVASHAAVLQGPTAKRFTFHTSVMHRAIAQIHTQLPITLAAALLTEVAPSGSCKPFRD